MFTFKEFVYNLFEQYKPDKITGGPFGSDITHEYHFPTHKLHVTFTKTEVPPIDNSNPKAPKDMPGKNHWNVDFTIIDRKSGKESYSLGYNIGSDDKDAPLPPNEVRMGTAGRVKSSLNTFIKRHRPNTVTATGNTEDKKNIYRRVLNRSMPKLGGKRILYPKTEPRKGRFGKPGTEGDSRGTAETLIYHFPHNK